METCGTEEPDEGKPHVRTCGGAGWVTTGSTRTPDCLQRPLRSRFRQQVSLGVRCLGNSGPIKDEERGNFVLMVFKEICSSLLIREILNNTPAR
jgi:hypothetical protein